MNPMNIFEAFQSKAAKKGLLLGIGEMFFQQFSGVNTMIFYTTLIFEVSQSVLYYILIEYNATTDISIEIKVSVQISR